MKKIFLILIIGFIVPNIYAQNIKEDKVPSTIIKDFNTKYSSAQKVKWKKVEELYFAKFVIDGKGVDVTYESNGSWVETMTEISVNELPSEVITGANNIFTGAKVKAAAKVEQTTKEIIYILQLQNKNQKAEITLDSKGNQVS